MADNKIFHTIGKHLTAAYQSVYLPATTGFGKQAAGEIRIIPAQANIQEKVDIRFTIASINYQRVQGNTFVSGGSIAFPFKLKDGDNILVRSLAYSEEAVTAITKANPGVITMATNVITEGQKVIVNGGDMTQITTGVHTASNVTATTFELQDEDGVNINTTTFTIYTTGGTVALHLGDALATFYEETVPQA